MQLVRIEAVSFVCASATASFFAKFNAAIGVARRDLSAHLAFSEAILTPAARISLGHGYVHVFDRARCSLDDLLAGAPAAVVFRGCRDRTLSALGSGIYGALSDIHALGYAHNDVSASNVLLFWDGDRCEAKLGDLERVGEPASGGTAPWTPAEVLSGAVVGGAWADLVAAERLMRAAADALGLTLPQIEGSWTSFFCAAPALPDSDCSATASPEPGPWPVPDAVRPRKSVYV